MKKPIVKIVLVFVLGIIVSRVFWFLGFFPNIFKNIIDPGNCIGKEIKSFQMYICSATVAFKTLIGPIIFVVLIFIFRKTIFKIVNNFKPKIPKDFQFLLSPLIATLIFTIVWSGSHFSTSDTMGILQQRSFPAIIGLFTFFTTEYYKQIQAKLKNFFIKRDRFPKVIRYLIAALIPIVLSLIITYQDRVTSVAVKEQFIVMISLISGYLVLIPKRGKIKLKQRK